MVTPLEVPRCCPAVNPGIVIHAVAVALTLVRVMMPLDLNIYARPIVEVKIAVGDGHCRQSRVETVWFSMIRPYLLLVLLIVALPTETAPLE